MKPKKHNNHEELNMWQPTADLMSGLMYILMLVVLLLGLYLLQIPEETEIDPYPGDSYDGGGWYGDGHTPTPTPTYTPDFDDGGGWYGGGGGGTHTYVPYHSPTVTPTCTPTPTPTYIPPSGSGGGTGGGNGGGDGPGTEPDNGFKSAVYVMVIDAETERTIKEADVQFELYMADGSLQILNTYYPERISFRSYVTTETGTFYLPEKLMQGDYELHMLTEPEGYDAAPNQTFYLHDLYDWPDPYVVRVPVYPSRNVIRVQLTDAATGLPVSGGAFEVISKEDVVTPDGTLRYRAGEIVSSIECDETGLGVSEEIYLGEYIVRQKDIPAYYASLTEDFEVTVSKKSDLEPPLNTVACERTRIVLNLADELYPATGLANVAFTVRSDLPGAQALELLTDSRGAITLDALEKGTTYRIAQSSTTGHYRADPDVHSVSIGSDGRIGGEAETTLALTNRLLRVTIGVTDEFSSVQVPGVSLALFSAADELVNSWTTTGSALMFDSLDAGAYYLIKDGDTEHRYGITVHDQAKIQTINIHTTYVMQYVLWGTAGAAAIAAVAVPVVLLRRRKKAAAKPVARSAKKPPKMKKIKPVKGMKQS